MTEDVRSPRNTTRAMQEDPAEALLFFADAMGSNNSSEAILRQEAAGQREMVNSDVIPTQLKGCTEDDLTALGFVLGDPVEGDPLFRRATLPKGWKREASDHDMWSFIVDPDGYRRCGIFFKAAFYDRRADMGLETLHNYVSACLYDCTPPVVRGEWATAEALLAAIAELRDEHTNSVRTWTVDHSDAPNAAQYAAEHAEKVKLCDAFAEAVRTAQTEIADA